MTSTKDSQLHTPLLPAEYDHPIMHIFKKSVDELV
jgi:hypothetical protein